MPVLSHTVSSVILPSADRSCAEGGLTGRIAQVVRSRACGFIRAADGQTVFFHASDLLGTTLHAIEDSLAVRFTLVPDPIRARGRWAFRLIKRSRPGRSASRAPRS